MDKKTKIRKNINILNIKKKPQQMLGLKVGDDILSQFYLVPSALTGLTSLFDKGRGDPCC